MKNTLLIIYMVVSSGSILILNNSLREVEGNVEIIVKVVEDHQSALEFHESAFRIILKSIRGLYT